LGSGQVAMSGLDTTTCIQALKLPNNANGLRKVAMLGRGPTIQLSAVIWVNRLILI